MANPPRQHKVDPGSKQSRVIAMLQSPANLFKIDHLLIIPTLKQGTALASPKWDFAERFRATADQRILNASF
jgi:hypothetical protein